MCLLLFWIWQSAIPLFRFRLNFVADRQLAHLGQQFLQRVGLGRIRKSAEQIFGLVDCFGYLFCSDQFLNPPLMFLPLFDLGVLADGF